LTCKHVLPHMIARKRGSIINVSSGAADRDFPPMTCYAVAKAAQERFSGCLAQDVKQHNIAVNVLRPGVLQTEGVWDHGYPLDPELIKLYPPPEVVVPSALWLAQLTDSAFTGRVLNYLEFGNIWP
jgi:NAD(P)-dependent dehydrogenase (short-subunit alcohol dehydrogenase family)